MCAGGGGERRGRGVFRPGEIQCADAGADNFTEAALPELVRFLHEHGLRAFCTVNTLIFTDELAEAERELMLLDAAGVDVIIVQDLGLAVL